MEERILYWIFKGSHDTAIQVRRDTVNLMLLSVALSPESLVWFLSDIWKIGVVCFVAGKYIFQIEIRFRLMWLLTKCFRLKLILIHNWKPNAQEFPHFQHLWWQEQAFECFFPSATLLNFLSNLLGVKWGIWICFNHLPTAWVHLSYTPALHRHLSWTTPIRSWIPFWMPQGDTRRVGKECCSYWIWKIQAQYQWNHGDLWCHLQILEALTLWRLLRMDN